MMAVDFEIPSRLVTLACVRQKRVDKLKPRQRAGR